MDDRGLIYYARVELEDLARRGRDVPALKEIVERLHRLEYWHSFDSEAMNHPEHVDGYVKYVKSLVSGAVGRGVTDAIPPEQTKDALDRPALRFAAYVLKPKAK